MPIPPRIVERLSITHDLASQNDRRNFLNILSYATSESSRTGSDSCWELQDISGSFWEHQESLGQLLGASESSSAAYESFWELQAASGSFL